jgi:hypothetical protein
LLFFVFAELTKAVRIIKSWMFIKFANMAEDRDFLKILLLSLLSLSFCDFLLLFRKDNGIKECSNALPPVNWGRFKWIRNLS